MADGEKQTEGEAAELQGEVEERVGRATGDPDLEAEGVEDRTIGEVEQAIDEAKQAWTEVREGGG